MIVHFCKYRSLRIKAWILINFSKNHSIIMTLDKWILFIAIVDFSNCIRKLGMYYNWTLTLKNGTVTA